MAPMVPMGVEQMISLIKSSYENYRAFQSTVEMERERLEKEEEDKRQLAKKQQEENKGQEEKKEVQPQQP